MGGHVKALYGVVSFTANVKQAVGANFEAECPAHGPTRVRANGGSGCRVVPHDGIAEKTGDEKLGCLRRSRKENRKPAEKKSEIIPHRNTCAEEALEKYPSRHVSRP